MPIFSNQKHPINILLTTIIYQKNHTLTEGFLFSSREMFDTLLFSKVNLEFLFIDTLAAVLHMEKKGLIKLSAPFRQTCVPSISLIDEDFLLNERRINQMTQPNLTNPRPYSLEEVAQQCEQWRATRVKGKLL